MAIKFERINEMTDRKAVCECNNNLIIANDQMISFVTYLVATHDYHQLLFKLLGTSAGRAGCLVDNS